MMRNLSTKQKIFIAVLLFGLFTVYQLVVIGSRAGEIKVNITVIPEGALVTINDKPSSAGAVYLKPGLYTFVASKEGFASDRQSVKVEGDSTEVGLVPAPESEEAIKWLQDNPEIQAQREEIGGFNANRKGENLQKQNPLVNDLPVTEVVGPFTIDYGPSTTRQNGIFLEVSNSSPDGRKNALKWIRQQNQDPTDFEIKYSDYINPFRASAGAGVEQ